MRNRFDMELDQLNQSLITMASLVENAIIRAYTSLVNQDIDLARSVVDGDKEIDEMEKMIERMCISLLMKQHPVASDLRLISSILKMITDLERIGDQAADIGEITMRLSSEKLIKDIVHIPQMAQATILMVNNSIKAFVDGDLLLADQVIKHDDIVDDFFNLIKDEVVDLIQRDKSNAEQGVDFLMIAKYLERIGDHAENIAEWVLFSITGRHKSQI